MYSTFAMRAAGNPVKTTFANVPVTVVPERTSNV
jgi:hypothetical protein